MDKLEERLRKLGRVIYIAVAEDVAADISKTVNEAADEITRLNAEVERLTAENARLSKAVCSGVLADLLSDDEAAALADFVKGLREPALILKARGKDANVG